MNAYSYIRTTKSQVIIWFVAGPDFECKNLAFSRTSKHPEGYSIIRTTNSQFVLVTPIVDRSLIHIASTTNPLPGKALEDPFLQERSFHLFILPCEKTSNVVVNDRAAEGYSKMITQLAATLYAKHGTSYQTEQGKFVGMMTAKPHGEEES